MREPKLLQVQVDKKFMGACIISRMLLGQVEQGVFMGRNNRDVAER